MGELVEAGLYYQESITLGRETGDKYNLVLLNCYLGLLALAQNQPDMARIYFEEGLTVAHRNNIMMYAIYNLIGMACLFQDQDRFAEATVLLAASSEIAKSIGIKIEPELQEPYDKALAGCRKKLSEQEFKTAWQTGVNMDFEQAVEFALEH